MGGEWRTVNLSTCASFQEGYVNPTQRREDYFGTEVKWLRAVDLNDTYVWDTSRMLTKAGFESAGKSALLFEPNTLAISKSGTIGRIGILKDYMCGNRAVINIKVNESIADSRYIFFVLLHGRREIENLAIGSVQKNLYTSELGKFEFDLPPLIQQRKIGDMLMSLNDKIELNRAINRTLEAMAQAIFKSWFVDFDPVKAKMAARESGNDPTRAAMAVISGKNDTELDAFQQQDPKNYEHLRNTAEAFPDALVDSELGLIPEGWGVGTIDQLIDFNPSRTLRKGVVAPYIEMKYMPTAGHTPELVYDRPFSGGAKFMNGDTLLARITPCLENGKTAYVDVLESGQIGWGSTEYIVMRTRVEAAPELSYFMARDDSFRAHAIRCMTGTSGRQRVEIHALKTYTMSMPPPILIEGFGKIARDLMSCARHFGGEIKSLAELRDTLLPRLMNREVCP